MAGLRRRLMAAVCAGLVAAGLASCTAHRSVQFDAGTTMQRLASAGKIRVGVKYDQPGLGFKNPATGKLEGFDIKIAEIIAAGLGLRPSQIVPVETVSQDRERFLQTDRVDIVVASYSITTEHRRDVGQAGPYFITGQQLLVRAADTHRFNDPDRLTGARICSATGSTSLARAKRMYGPRMVEYPTYTECVRQLLRKSVDVVTTDGAVLLGYHNQQPDKLVVVGRPFSEERYGIGYRKGDRAFCQFLTDTLNHALANGDWERAFKDTLGKAKAAIPAKPVTDPCQD
jgi:glutamate transport system substrate-binding protein